MQACENIRSVCPNSAEEMNKPSVTLNHYFAPVCSPFCTLLTDQPKSDILSPFTTPFSENHTRITMAAFRTNSTIARSLLSAVSRRTLIRPVLAPAARSFSILTKPDATTSSAFKNNTQQKQGFATSLADFSIKSDDSLDQAQQYMDEGVSFQANNMLPLAMSSFQKSINVRPTGRLLAILLPRPCFRGTGVALAVVQTCLHGHHCHMISKRRTLSSPDSSTPPHMSKKAHTN